MYRIYYHPHYGNGYTGEEWIGTNDTHEAYIRGTMIISGWEYEHIFKEKEKVETKG